ncbi:hypothetical protein L6R52_10920 [Myxococcota bacterium]|nr:hypothetical protein [Myxococcota bacterium]
MTSKFDPTTASRASANCAKLRRAFEGREAIYIEKGVLRVRVMRISCDFSARRIDADVEEVLTPGLSNRSLQGREEGLRWKISAGYLTTFSAHGWAMGYGGWQLFFEPDLVGDLTRLAAAWPTELRRVERYERALRFLVDRDAYAASERVFTD